MKGQLSEHPLVELILEISERRLSGALRLARERVKAVVYAEGGEVIYARSNLRLHRLDESLRRWQMFAEEQLAGLAAEEMSDAQIGAMLVSSGALTRDELLKLQARQCADVLRPVLLLTDGEWTFERRARLDEEMRLKIETEQLLLEAARRLPADFVAARVADDAEMLAPAAAPRADLQLAPAEAFVFSRAEAGPLRVGDLVALSGLPEAETRHIVYALVAARLLAREHKPQALTAEAIAAHEAQASKAASAAEGATKTPAAKQASKATAVSEQAQANASEESDAPAPARDPQAELTALFTHTEATNLYALLAVAPDADEATIKRAYYALAKRFHPDRFHKDAEADLRTRIESAFAKIAHAYEVLKNPKQRALYDSKQKIAQKSAPPKPEQTPPVHPAAAGMSKDYRAEESFQQGLAALQQSNYAMALPYLAEAARLMPRNARYRAYYGRALAQEPRNRRLAESELLAANALEPRNASFRVMLAELYSSLGMRSRAEGELQRALDIEPQNANARRLLRTLKQ